MQYILVYETDLLAGRNLDTIVICAIYVTLRLNKVQVSWGKLEKAYQALARFDRDDYLSVFLEVRSSFSPDGGQFGRKKVDIQHFYNNCFCKAISKWVEAKKGRKSALAGPADSPGDLKAPFRTPVLKHLLTSKILKETLSTTIRGARFRPINWAHRRKSLASTKMLFKFGESPYQNLRSYNSLLQKRSQRSQDLLAKFSLGARK